MVYRHTALLRILLFDQKGIRIPRKEDSFTLTAGFRFYNESFIPLFADHRYELLEVVRQHEGLRREIVLLRVFLLHAHQVSAKHVFLRQIVDSWEVVAPLPGVHLGQNAHGDGSVPPGQVPLVILVLCQVVICLKLSDLFYYIVVGLASPHGQAIISFFWHFATDLFGE